MSDKSGEKERLASIAENAGYIDNAVNVAGVNYLFEIITRHLQPGAILEIGPAEGVMTDRLIALAHPLSILESATKYCDDIADRHPSATVHNGLIEEFEPDEGYDTIILGHVLEHVEAPVEALRRIGSWLKPGGRIITAVPNARSVHRQAATIMGLLDVETQLNETDIRIGHRRVYTPETFRAEFTQAGLEIQISGGYWLKPLSNGQIEESWTAEMIAAFMRLGERYPDIAAEIYLVAGRT